MSDHAPPPAWHAFRDQLRMQSGLPPLDADGRAARAISCPWCKAEPGMPCVTPRGYTRDGTPWGGHPLTLTTHHPSRHEAAGVRPPAVSSDTRHLASKQGQPAPLFGEADDQ